MAAAQAQRARVVEFLFDATQDAALSERLGFPLLSASLSSGADLVVANRSPDGSKDGRIPVIVISYVASRLNAGRHTGGGVAIRL